MLRAFRCFVSQVYLAIVAAPKKPICYDGVISDFLHSRISPLDHIRILGELILLSDHITTEVSLIGNPLDLGSSESLITVRHAIC